MNEKVYSSLIPEGQRVLKELCALYPEAAVVLYGSHASFQADEASDIDVLIVSNNISAPLKQERTIVFATEVDLSTSGPDFIRRKLGAQYPDNNNYFLNIFRKCHILTDPVGHAQNLFLDAIKIAESGPPALTEAGFQARRIGLERLLYSIHGLSRRASKDANARAVVYLKCDQMAVGAIYLFYCLRRQWTVGLYRLLNSMSAEYPGLFELWLRYRSACELGETVGCAESILKYVCDDYVILKRT